MLYERKIKYLDYYEGGEKIRSGGFVKLELKDDKLCLELTVKGLYPTDSFMRDVVLRSGGAEAALGQITIENGYGTFRYAGDLEQEMGHTGIVYGALREIRIPIGGSRELVCPLSDAARSCEGQEQAEVFRKEARKIPQQELQETVREEKQTGVTEASEISKPTKAVEQQSEAQYKARDKAQDKAQDMPQSDDRKQDIDELLEEDLRRVWASKTDQGENNVVQTDDSVSETFESEVPISETSVPERFSTKVSGAGEFVSETPVHGSFLTEVSGAEVSISEASAPERVSAEDPVRRVSAPEIPASEKLTTQGDGDRGVETLQSGVHLSEPKAKAENSAGERHSDGRGKNATKLLEDKWQQLSAIYPHIQPFKDERDYLSISPSDFVLFPSKCYKAVNNSFLLHGYYNYNHLILARIEHRGEIVYYIGVPGNYFDREKQVAIMFGFESFECAAEPARTGDFGYYMMRTEL